MRIKLLAPHTGTITLLAAGLAAWLVCWSSPALAQEALSIDGSGNVGIGTTAPETHVHIEGTGGQVLLVESSSAAVADISLKNTANIWGFRSNTAGNFSIVDRTEQRLVFTIEKQAPVQSMYIDASGDVGIGGATSPALRLHVADTSGDGPVLRLQDSTTSCDADPEPGEPVWSCPSDVRLKTNLRPVDTGAILRRLAEIGLYDYELVSTGTSHMGPVAQYLQETQPERVKEAEDGTLMVSLPGRAELLGAVQELQKQMVELRHQIDSLQQELDAARNH